MKIACICCTYLRSHLLEQMIACFEAQTFPLEDRELIILDDAGEYENMNGTGWKLFSVPGRFQNLGVKRNAATALASSRAEVYSVWDDDDLYLPHALETIARRIEGHDFLRPSTVIVERNGVFVRGETGGLYHGGWAYSRAAFEKVGGYRAVNSGEDQELCARLEAAGYQTIDPLDDGTPPYYIYRENGNNAFHISWLGEGPVAWQVLGVMQHNGRKSQLNLNLPYDLNSIPIPAETSPRPF